jgi:hypothetical protein
MSNTTLNFDNELRFDLFVTALEGGSNYWYYLSDEAVDKINNHSNTDGNLFTELMWKYILDGNSIDINDIECPDELLGSISLESIQKGEETMFQNSLWHYTNAKEESWDADTADVWFQYAVMNDIVFG